MSRSTNAKCINPTRRLPMIRRTLLSLALFVGLAAPAPSGPLDAELHFALSRSSPEAGASAESPSEIRLWFTEVPEAKTTSIRLIGSDRDAIDTGDVSQDERDGRSFSVALEHVLSAGTYTVSWRAMGDDGHVVRDSYEFTVVAQ